MSEPTTDETPDSNRYEIVFVAEGVVTATPEGTENR